MRGVLQDLERSVLSEKDKALFSFILTVNTYSSDISVKDMKALHEAGWTDEAIYYAITVCALFNFYNRWIDASGVHPLPDEAQRNFAARTAHHGYVRE